MRSGFIDSFRPSNRGYLAHSRVQPFADSHGFRALLTSDPGFFDAGTLVPRGMKAPRAHATKRPPFFLRLIFMALSDASSKCLKVESLSSTAKGDASLAVERMNPLSGVQSHRDNSLVRGDGKRIAKLDPQV
jgi:hypothetical protein